MDGDVVCVFVGAARAGVAFPPCSGAGGLGCCGTVGWLGCEMVEPCRSVWERRDIVAMFGFVHYTVKANVRIVCAVSVEVMVS